VTPRETLLSETFVALADTLVTDFDVIDFLSLLAQRCLTLFDAGEAGLLLADSNGKMQLAASSSHQMELLELLELQHDEGPCPDAYRSGTQIECTDLNDALDRWPTFAPAATEAGFRSALALPMRLRGNVIGALNLIRIDPGSLPAPDIAAAQALADVATIGLLQHRAAAESRVLTEQLQYALTSRVVIEQAKGVIAERLGLDMGDAFDLLRRYSRNQNQRLADTASGIVARTLETDLLRDP
jgi:GAF domain-containing protein